MSALGGHFAALGQSHNLTYDGDCRAFGNDIDRGVDQALGKAELPAEFDLLNHFAG